MAAGKAQDSRVKDFANMMVKDHTDALNRLKAIHGSNASGVKPNAKHQQTADRLSSLSTSEFDRAYMTAMVNDHQEAVKVLTQISSQKPAGAADAHSQDLSKIAGELLPTVRQHLQMAQQIETQINSSAAASRPSPSGSNSTKKN
jgi:putative membrane protein